jgi:hypothetical protein
MGTSSIGPTRSMSYLNSSIPEFYCLGRKEFFYNQKKGFGEYENVMVFGARCRAGRAIEFHVVTDSGMQFMGLPPHALCTKPCERPKLIDSQLWDCFGDEFEVTKFDYLENMRCKYRRESDGKMLDGNYVMTFDWTDNAFSDDPSQRKNAHLIALDSGNYTLQPNNRTLWFDPAWTDKEPPLDWEVNEKIWSSETQHERAKENKFFYK